MLKLMLPKDKSLTTSLLLQRGKMKRYLLFLFPTVLITRCVSQFYDWLFASPIPLFWSVYDKNILSVLGVLLMVFGCLILITLIKTGNTKKAFFGALGKVLLCNVFVGLGYGLIFRLTY